MKTDLITDAEYAQIGKIVFKYLDRLGDPHPGIDDAEMICAELCQVIDLYLDSEVWPRIFPFLNERKEWEDPLDRA